MEAVFAFFEKTDPACSGGGDGHGGGVARERQRRDLMKHK
jgi:hypothetical protein